MESSNDPRILIGIGKADEVETLLVRWPSGAITKQEHLKPGRSYSLVEPADVPSGPSQPSTQRR
jgi:enediyne biosynthesis protein E4